MNEIKNVVLCGLGGLGCICAASIQDSGAGDFRVLLDKERCKKYSSAHTYFNDKLYDFHYILPSDTDFKADLVIIATKNNGLDEAIENLKNFVKEDTVFISLLNGIHSENTIAGVYSDKNIVTSYYIGHSCVREERRIYQDGIYEIVMGIRHSYQQKALDLISSYFDRTGIHYKIPADIISEYWKKFMINVGINQLSAVTGLTLKDIKKDEKHAQSLKKAMYEAELIAEKEGLKNHKAVYESAVKFLFSDIDDAVPSMLQDIKAGRKTEVDIFAGEILRLGKKYNVQTPENEKLYNEIKLLELSGV